MSECNRNMTPQPSDLNTF